MNRDVSGSAATTVDCSTHHLVESVAEDFVGSSVEQNANPLLVDDDPAKRLALSSVLESLGHNLFLAESGQKALRLLLQRDYAVVLLDVQMPDMDGLEIAKLMREHGQSRHTPIIFITAHDQAEIEVRRGYSLGAVDYIFTPVISEILCAKVRVFIDLAVMRHKLENEIAKRKRAAKEVNSLNAELEERAAELEQANKELESFTYSVSHDLRAPLRAVDGYARMLEEDYGERLDAEGRRLLTVMRNSATHMGQLIDDLLAFSRLSRKPMAAAVVDMAGLAREVLGELKIDYPRAKTVLRELPAAHGDRALLKQVWANLLGNALKYSSKRQDPRIEIDGRAEQAENVFWVRDNGAGFDMRYASKLFGVFQRLHREDEFSGTGVGLAIVQRVLARHGGRAWAEGKPGEGACFHFALPKTQ
jgi:signal transduction histidine kinase